MEPDGTLVPGIVAGVLFGLEFMLIYRGLVWTSASRASLFLYTAPFIVVIGARWLLPGDRFDRWQWVGIGAVVRRHGGRLRRADAGRQSATSWSAT